MPKGSAVRAAPPNFNPITMVGGTFPAGSVAGVLVGNLVGPDLGAWTYAIDPAFNAGGAVAVSGPTVVTTATTAYTDQSWTIRLTATRGSTVITTDILIAATSPTDIPISALSAAPLELYGTCRVVAGYTGNFFRLSKVPQSTNAADFAYFGAASAGGLWPDWDAIVAWAGQEQPEIVEWVGQVNGRNATTVATQRPRLNTVRRDGSIVHAAITGFSGASKDEFGTNRNSNPYFVLPATITANRGNCSVAMVADIPSNALDGSLFALGATNATRFIGKHGAGSYATTPGLRLVNNNSRASGIKVRNQYQSIIMTDSYGGGAANSASNFARVSVDGETAYQVSGAITDAAMVGGEIGSDNATSRVYGQFGSPFFGVWASPLTANDELLIHSHNAAKFNTRVPTALKHMLFYGSSTMQGYRSDINGFASQLLKALGMPLKVTGYGRSGVSLGQADTDAVTVAGFKDPTCTDHLVTLHGGINDIVSLAETAIDTPAEITAAANTLYATLLSVVGKFRANTTVTGNPWKVMVMIQHMRDIGQIGGVNSTWVANRYAVLAQYTALVKANASGAAYTWFDPNDNTGIAAYPNTGMRDTDDVHLGEKTGLPAAVAVALPFYQTLLAA